MKNAVKNRQMKQFYLKQKLCHLIKTTNYYYCFGCYNYRKIHQTYTQWVGQDDYNFANSRILTNIYDTCNIYSVKLEFI